MAQPLLALLRGDQLEARKAKDVIKSGLLTTLISDSVMVGKNNGNRETTELEVVQTIKKYIKTAEENLQLMDKKFGDLDEPLIKVKKELEILQAYLPKQMDLEQLRTEVLAIIEKVGKSPKAMGAVMKDLRTQFEGQYDGAMASQLVKEELAK